MASSTASVYAYVYQCGMHTAHRIKSEPRHYTDTHQNILSPPREGSSRSCFNLVLHDATALSGHSDTNVAVDALSPSPIPPKTFYSTISYPLIPPPPMVDIEKTAAFAGKKQIVADGTVDGSTESPDGPLAVRQRRYRDSGLSGNGASMSAEGFDYSGDANSNTTAPTTLLPEVEDTIQIAGSAIRDGLEVFLCSDSLQQHPSNVKRRRQAVAVTTMDDNEGYSPPAERGKEQEVRALFPGDLSSSTIHPDEETTGMLDASASVNVSHVHPLHSILSPEDADLQLNTMEHCAFTPNRPERTASCASQARSTSTVISHSSIPTLTDHGMMWVHPPVAVPEEFTIPPLFPSSARLHNTTPQALEKEPGTAASIPMGSGRASSNGLHTQASTPRREDTVTESSTAFPSPVKLSPIPTKAYATGATILPTHTALAPTTAMVGVPWKPPHEAAPSLTTEDQAWQVPLKAQAELNTSEPGAVDISSERAEQTTCVWSEHASLQGGPSASFSVLSVTAATKSVEASDSAELNAPPRRSWALTPPPAALSDSLYSTASAVTYKPSVSGIPSLCKADRDATLCFSALPIPGLHGPSVLGHSSLPSDSSRQTLWQSAVLNSCVREACGNGKSQWIHSTSPNSSASTCGCRSSVAHPYQKADSCASTDAKDCCGELPHGHIDHLMRPVAHHKSTQVSRLDLELRWNSSFLNGRLTRFQEAYPQRATTTRVSSKHKERESIVCTTSLTAPQVGVGHLESATKAIDSFL